MPLVFPTLNVLFFSYLIYKNQFYNLSWTLEGSVLDSAQFVLCWGFVIVGAANALSSLIWATIRGKLIFVDKTSWMKLDD